MLMVAAVVAFAALLSGLLGLAYWQTINAPRETQHDPHINVYETPVLPRVDTAAGYQRKDPPQAAITTVQQPLPATVTTTPTVTQAVVHTAPPPPPQPLMSGFVGQMAPPIESGSQGGAAGGGNMPGVPGDEYRPGMHDNKNAAWLAEAGTGGRDFVTSPFMPPISRYMLQTSITIKARLMHAVDSDLPGDVAAIIPEQVCDTPTGRQILIPAASRLFGRYNDQVGYAQTRAQISWNRILFTDGSSINIGSMNGIDDIGRAGATGNVNNHPWGMAGAIALSTFSTLIGQAGTILQGGSGQTTIGVVGADAAGRTTSDIGNQIAQKQLARPNTIEICMSPDDSTCNIAVMLTKDISLPPRGECN